MPDKDYIVATIRPWNIEQYHNTVSALPGNWHLVTDPGNLTFEYLTSINPRYIFFPHWSHVVSKDIINRFECVCFHETDLPFGRGGSPLQNLINKGHKNTVITALRMVEELDAGPVYSKRPLSLIGLAEEIFINAAKIIFTMIQEIVLNEPTPEPQKGKPIIFERRTPDQSVVSKDIQSISDLFDHIRMLDAEEYPHAFIEYGGFRIEFTRPALRTGRIETTANITLISKKGSTNELL